MNEQHNESSIEEGKRQMDWNPVTGMEDNFSLYAAVSDPENNNPIDISEVIEKLSKTESLEEGESICYIGCGNFAVVRLGPDNEDGFELKRMIEYENRNERVEWRTELRLKTNAHYQPNPQSLRSLYSAEQIREMPKFN